MDEPQTFRPNETQKVKDELDRAGESDRHRVHELYMHLIENCERGVEANNVSIHALAREIVTQEDVRDLICVELAKDMQARRKAAKLHYAVIVLRYIVPALLTGGAITELGHALGWFADWLSRLQL